MPTGIYYLACTTYSSPERNRAALYRKMSPFGVQGCKARIARLRISLRIWICASLLGHNLTIGHHFNSNTFYFLTTVEDLTLKSLREKKSVRILKSDIGILKCLYLVE